MTPPVEILQPINGSSPSWITKTAAKTLQAATCFPLMMHTLKLCFKLQKLGQYILNKKPVVPFA
jgi:hypothetical protein